jgi:hypothetical protein
MPTNTDLVTDLPADFEVFGQAVATSMADLLGGTTGQVLSKTSNTDMDFTWVAPTTGDITGVTAGTGISGGGTSGDVTITNSMATAITTAGDLIKGTGSGTFARLGIGSTGQVLTVSGGAPAWAAAPTGKIAQVIFGQTSSTVSNSTSTYADTGLTATITPSSATSTILVLVNQNGVFKSNGNSLNNNEVKLLRGATTLINTMTGGYTNTALNNNVGAVSASYLDSPATTSATIYKTQYRCDNNTASVSVQYNASTSTMILMEVLA